jgi:hypothetical protein
MKLDSTNQKKRVGVMKTSQHGESRKCKMQKLLEKERWYAEDVEENMHGPVHRMGHKLSLLGLKLLCGASSPQMTFRAADVSRTMPIESLR